MMAGSYAAASSQRRRSSLAHDGFLPQMNPDDAAGCILPAQPRTDGSAPVSGKRSPTPPGGRPRSGSSAMVSPDVGVINDINNRYAMEDVSQCMELYEALREAGALTRGCWSGRGAMPNALDILGTADDRDAPPSSSAALAVGDRGGLQRAASLKHLIKKHGIGQDKGKMAVLTLQQLVSMVCVPIREKRYINSSSNRRGTIGFNTSSAVLIPSFLDTSKTKKSARNQDNDDDGDDGAATTTAVSTRKDDADRNLHSTDSTFTSALKSLGHYDRAEDDSRAVSPDLFGEIRGDSPDLLQQQQRLLLQAQAEKQHRSDKESSPERLLSRLAQVTNAQHERSQRAKRVVHLSRKDLYAACDINDVSTYTAGYALNDHGGGRLRDFSGAPDGETKKNGPVHPLLVDEEVRAARDAQVRAMSKPRHIRPAPFHGAAARSIGGLQPVPHLFDSKTMTAAPTPHRHPPHPSTARSNATSGRAPLASSRTQAHRPGSSRPATARSATWQQQQQQQQRRPHSPGSDSIASVDSDTNTGTDAGAHGSGSFSELDRDAKAMAASSGARGVLMGGQDPYREAVRAGKLHMLIDKPGVARAQHGKQQSTVPNLSAKVKLREVQRQLEDERNTLGGYGTSRTMTKRLKLIEAGKDVKMFNDVESKLLQMWIQ